ncbi:hypothetical protein IC235_17670 [Hymenobacter sp. BT664]|uniref:Uncharacterized protein n=1 Tax=Hymenobacter montanus TaxID=2771359 RepID=A0A927GKM7_9BACT|nr:hypothetical protein [Hymenobacter montanus]MBD2769722.1 hypothetical protein [Hymenobacter montanus]
MTTSIYKLTSPKIKGGGIYLNYQAGFLKAIDVADAQPTAEQLGYLLNVLPVYEKELAAIKWGTMNVVPLPEKSVKDKIKQYCAAYKEYRDVTYTPTQTEKSNIRTVPVNSELLTVFFESPLRDYSINNYIKRINVTKDILKNGRDIQERFPNDYNHELYHKLPPDRLLAYQKHLHALGYRRNKVGKWVLGDQL